MNRKRALSILIMLVMLISMSLPVMAGKNDSLIKISDWKGLYNIRNNLSADYILVKDLSEKSPGYSLYAGNSADGGKGWLPIGDMSAPFSGSFNANGHKIADLYIYRPDTDYIGLFGFILGGKLSNLTLENSDITGRDHVGTLTGSIKRGEFMEDNHIVSCTAAGILHGVNNIGGLAGSLYGEVSFADYICINNSNSSVYVISESLIPEEFTYNVGGLTGFAHGDVIDSFASGNVEGIGDNIGGLVGQATFSSTFENCYSTGNVVGKNYVGGLVGGTSLDSNADIELINCHTSGNVTGIDNVGGLIGKARGTDIINCVTSGDVVGNIYVGGIGGYIYRGSNIDECFSTSNVEGLTDVGGLTGFLHWTNIVNSYTRCQVNGYDNVGGISGHLVQASIFDSYSLSSVYGHNNVGGIIGYCTFYDALFRTYAAGSVLGSVNTNGLVGYLEMGDQDPISISTNFYDNYWDIETTGQSNSVLIGTGLTTEEMVQMSSFNSWDFENVWTIQVGLSYPYLRWQGDVNIPYVGDVPVNNSSVIVTTDQTTYIRNNTVNIEATVSDSLGSPVAGSTVKITIVEPRKDSIVLNQELETNSEGKVFTTFEILRTTTKGTYSVTAEIIGTEVTHTCYFEVK